MAHPRLEHYNTMASIEPSRRTCLATTGSKVPARAFPGRLLGALVLLVAQMRGELALEGGLDHELGQLGHQAALAVDRQPLPLRVADQLRDQRPVHPRNRRQHGLTAAGPMLHGISHDSIRARPSINTRRVPPA